MPNNQGTRGGKRPGAGRKARHGERMQQKTVRLPAEWVARLAAEFGSLQLALETLAARHLGEDE
jgi:hypothetical protein